MKRWSKGWWIVIICWVVMSDFAYIILCIKYHIPEKSLVVQLLVATGVVITVYIIVDLVYVFIYLKKGKRVAALFDEGRTEECIAAIEKDLRIMDDKKALCNMWKINLAVGYCRLKQYDKALSVLEGVYRKKLNVENKAVYALDLFCVYYELGQKEKAMEVYDANEKYLALIRKDTKYSGNIAIIDMYAAIEKGQFEGLEEKLRRTRDTWHNPAFQEDYEKIEELLLRQNA